MISGLEVAVFGVFKYPFFGDWWTSVAKQDALEQYELGNFCMV